MDLEGDDITVGIVGLGLIGGSLARRLHPEVAVVCFDADPETRKAAQREGLTAVSSVAALVERPLDVVFVATPMPDFAAVFGELARLGAGQDFVVSDVGSAKSAVREVAARTFGPRPRYLGSHPMAGTEHSGFSAANPRLFEAATWALCVEADSDRRDFAVLARLLTRIGVDVVPLTASVHDRAVAATSHLPHVVAGAVANLVGETPDQPLLHRMAAGSFRSTTRVAGTRPELATEMCVANRHALVRALEELLAILEEVHQHLATSRDDEVARFFESAHRWHGELVTQPPTVPSTTEITLDWTDGPLPPDDRAHLLAVGEAGGVVTDVRFDKMAQRCTVTCVAPR